jgi:hypothetical protein
LASTTKGATTFVHEQGSGNVFVNSSLSDADERLARSKLGHHVHKRLADRKVTVQISPHRPGGPYQ